MRRNHRLHPGIGYVSFRAFLAKQDRWAVNRSGGLHDAERNSGGFGETGAAGGGGNGLVVTTTATEQMTEFAVLTVEAPG
jgi:hypothetical protein